MVVQSRIRQVWYLRIKFNSMSLMIEQSNVKRSIALHALDCTIITSSIVFLYM